MSKPASKPQFENRLSTTVKSILRFRVLLFLLLVVIIYGYVAWQFNQLNNAQPSQNAVASQNSITQPHIDPVVVNKIKQLQDNSVSVQALFNQARQNPFQE